MQEKKPMVEKKYPNHALNARAMICVLYLLLKEVTVLFLELFMLSILSAFCSKLFLGLPGRRMSDSEKQFSSRENVTNMMTGNDSGLRAPLVAIHHIPSGMFPDVGRRIVS